MDNQKAALQQFVEAAKSKGASDDFLSAFLTRRGWSADEVYGALGRYWETLTGIAIPERAGSGESARDAFLYLLSFATLATWSTSLGSLIFSFIDYWFRDPLKSAYLENMRPALTWDMARIAIAYPIYLLVTRVTVREARNFPDRLQSGVRKWLTYIALLGTAGTMICDLVWFLNNLLAGEITERFVLKSATVMVIAGMIFAYYLSSLKSRRINVPQSKLRNLAFAGASALAVLTSFSIGMSIAGTPSQQRLLEADDVRIGNLHTIANAVNAWHRRETFRDPQATLPQNLNLLVQSGNLAFTATQDPETHMAYTYRPRMSNQYELCANFMSAEQPGHMGRMPHSDFWHHGTGETCYVLDASQAVPW